MTLNISRHLHMASFYQRTHPSVTTERPDDLLAGLQRLGGGGPRRANRGDRARARAVAQTLRPRARRPMPGLRRTRPLQRELEEERVPLPRLWPGRRRD